MGIESVLEKYANCGELAMIIKDAWNLNVIPHISSFEVHRIASKERRKHAVQLSALEIMKRATSKSKSKSKKLAVSEFVPSKILPVESCSPPISPVATCSPGTPSTRIGPMDTLSSDINDEGIEGNTTGGTSMIDELRKLSRNSTEAASAHF